MRFSAYFLPAISHSAIHTSGQIHGTVFPYRTEPNRNAQLYGNHDRTNNNKIIQNAQSNSLYTFNVYLRWFVVFISQFIGKNLVQHKKTIYI